jgi:hypothetical protein
MVVCALVFVRQKEIQYGKEGEWERGGGGMERKKERDSGKSVNSQGILGVGRHSFAPVKK